MAQDNYDEQIFQLRIHGHKVNKMYNYRKSVTSKRKANKFSPDVTSRLDRLSARIKEHVNKDGGKSTFNPNKW